MVESKLNKRALDNYSKSFSTIIIDKFFSENPSITGQQIVDLTPIKQLNFFILKVLFSQWQKETKKFKSPYFDYQNEQVKQDLKALVNTLSKNISIGKDAFAPLLETAVLDTLTLIYEPRFYFSQEIDSLNSNNLASNFKSLSRYIKLNKEAFNQISKELDEGNIEKDDSAMDDLIHYVSEKIMLEDNETEINFFNEILAIDFLETEEKVVSRENEVTTEIIIPEVQESVEEAPENIQSQVEPREEEPSNLDEEYKPIDENPDLEEAVETEIENDLGVEEVIKPEIEKVVEEPLNEEVIEEPVENIEPDKKETKDISEEKPEEEIEEEVENKPTEILESEEKEESPSNINEQFTSDTQTINDQFEEMEKITTVVEQHEASPVSELHSSINVNQRYLFLNDLFGGDENEYNSAIESIENCESFDDSVEHLLQNYSRKFQWNMGSDEVKELLKVIFKKFR